MVTQWEGLVTQWEGLISYMVEVGIQWEGLVTEWEGLVTQWEGLISYMVGVVIQWEGLVSMERLVTQKEGLHVCRSSQAAQSNNIIIRLFWFKVLNSTSKQLPLYLYMH